MFPLAVVVAGVTGTTLMTMTMWFTHRQGWANADMIRAIGTLVTRRYERSLGPGLVIHYVAGCLFAIPYLLVIRALGGMSFMQNVMVCGAIGIFHSAAMLFVLMALFGDNHPIERFRKASTEVAAAYIVGHIVYGVGVGIIAALMIHGKGHFFAAVPRALRLG
jgi:uncharacterized membrane protein YagU involved in acid resistance